MLWNASNKTATSRWMMMLGLLYTVFVSLLVNCHMEELWHIWAFLEFDTSNVSGSGACFRWVRTGHPVVPVCSTSHAHIYYWR